MRKDLKPVLSALVIRHFLIIYAITVIYTGVCVTLLSKVEMWDFSMLKDTAIWMIFAALPAMYKAGRIPDIKQYFKTILVELAQITFFLEFVVGLHTYDLWKELLLAVLVLFLKGLIFYSQKPEQMQVHKIFKKVDTAISLGMILLVCIYLYKHFLEYWTLAYLEQFVLPVELTLMLTPFLYLLIVYMRFEETFTTIDSRIKPHKLLIFTKWMLMLHFLNNLAGIKRWEQQFFMRRPVTKQDVLNSIKDVKELQAAEANPPEVLLTNGWSPYLSRDFMKVHLLSAGQYLNHYDDSWGAISSTLHLSDDYLANDIIYEVTGTKTVVTQIELILKVFDRSKKGNAHEVFAKYLKYLFEEVFPGKTVPVELINRILKGKAYQMSYNTYLLVCDLDLYDNHLNSYNLKFAIRHPNHVA